MPFCYSPWTNIDISPTGEIMPCCKFQFERYIDPPKNIKTNSIGEYLNSDVLKDTKKHFLDGRWPTGCERCKIEEESGIESKRQLDYIRWKSDYENYDISSEKFLTASIAFGNTCNLKCITCGPDNSSKWRKEAKSIYNKDVKSFRLKNNNFAEEILELIQEEIIHLDIPGGEPFISGVDEQKYILQALVQSGRAKDISIHYVTNVTVFPDNSWWELWSHFKEIDMQLSIDGLYDQYEYIRFPANWKNTYNNIKKYQDFEKNMDNLRLSISHTVSAYNIFYIDDFFEWCYNESLPTPWLGRVHYPIHMRPSVWPPDIKNEIINNLKDSLHEDVKNWVVLLDNTDDSEHFTKFVDYLHKHDEYRNLNFSKTFPELAKFIK